MVADGRVVKPAVPAISVGELNDELEDSCHFTTLPVWPDNVREAGVCPAQIVWVVAAAPPIDVELIAILTPLSVPMVAGAGLVTRIRYNVPAPVPDGIVADIGEPEPVPITVDDVKEPVASDSSAWKVPVYVPVVEKTTLTGISALLQYGPKAVTLVVMEFPAQVFTVNVAPVDGVELPQVLTAITR